MALSIVPNFTTIPMADVAVKSQQLIDTARSSYQHTSSSGTAHSGGGGRLSVPDSQNTATSAAEDKPDPLQEILDSLRTAINSYQTSALKAQTDEADLVRRWNANEARIAREFSAEEANRARLFQAAREDSAYQRLVKDLSAAGLNPILAFGQGGSASTSTGSYPVAQSFSSSGSQANLSSAKNADKLDLDDLIPVFLFPLLNNVLGIVKEGLDAFKEKEFKFSLFG